MKVGDLVKRKNIWNDWIDKNPGWKDIDLPSDVSFGIILWWNGDMKPMIMWGDGQIKREWLGDLEVLSESR